MHFLQFYQSPLGEISLASNGECLTGLWFKGQKNYGYTLALEYKDETVRVLEETKRWLDIYFQGKDPDFMPQVEVSATSFRMSVWDHLREIPYGKTTTYGNIAAALAKERGVGQMSAQAVGNAVGRNPISIIIPCHRVIGSDGNLTGYAGGLEKKVALLRLEGVDSESMHKYSNV